MNENLIKDKTYTTKVIWVADETIIGSFYVFSVISLRSRAILGYAISKGEYVTPDDMITLFNDIIKKLEKEGHGYPEILHVDMSRVQ